MDLNRVRHRTRVLYATGSTLASFWLEGDLSTMSESRATNASVLDLNLDSVRYGSIAEIGASQEVSLRYGGVIVSRRWAAIVVGVSRNRTKIRDGAS